MTCECCVAGCRIPRAVPIEAVLAVCSASSLPRQPEGDVATHGRDAAQVSTARVRRQGASHAHTHAHARKRAPAHKPTYTHTHTHARTHARTRARTHTHRHKNTHSLTHSLTHARTHARTHSLTHARTHALTHSHAHARTHAHTRTPLARVLLRRGAARYNTNTPSRAFEHRWATDTIADALYIYWHTVRCRTARYTTSTRSAASSCRRSCPSSLRIRSGANARHGTAQPAAWPWQGFARVGRQDDFDILQFGSFVTGISPFVFCLRSARPPLRMETRSAIRGKNTATGTNPSAGPWGGAS
jgi:hypothetical protein